MTALVALVALPGALLLSVAAYEQRSQALAEIRETAIGTANALAASQTKLIDDTRDYLRHLAAHPDALRPAAPECSQFLGRILALSPNYINLGIPLANGDLLCNALPLSKPVNVADRPYIQRALGSRAFTIGEYQLDRAAKVSSVNFAYPVIDAKTGQVMGAAVAVASLDWWSRRLSMAQLPAGAIAFVTDSQDTVIAAFPDASDRLGKKPDRKTIDFSLSDELRG